MEPINASDITLVKNCVANQVEAWEIFVRKYSSLIELTVFITLRNYGVRDNLEEQKRDVTQEVFLALRENDNRRLRSYKNEKGHSFAGWLRVVTARIVIDQLRRKKQSFISIYEPTASGEEWGNSRLVSKAPRPDSQMEEQAVIAFIRKEVGQMSTKDQLIMKLLYEDGLSIKNVSKIVGLNPGTLYTRLSRIKAKIREGAKKEKIL